MDYLVLNLALVLHGINVCGIRKELPQLGRHVCGNLLRMCSRTKPPNQVEPRCSPQMEQRILSRHCRFSCNWHPEVRRVGLAPVAIETRRRNADQGHGNAVDGEIAADHRGITTVLLL